MLAVVTVFKDSVDHCQVEMVQEIQVGAKDKQLGGTP